MLGPQPNFAKAAVAYATPPCAKSKCQSDICAFKRTRGALGRLGVLEQFGNEHFPGELPERSGLLA